MKKIPALSISVTSESAATPSAPGVVPESPALPAIVAKAFGRLNNRLRARMLRRLLTSVGPLALTVVGGGAFAKYLKHARWTEIPVSMEDAARATSSQVYELARYVQQADPQLFGQLFDILSRDAATVTWISASIVALTITRFSSSVRRQRKGALSTEKT
jgi:hypothetical protein